MVDKNYLGIQTISIRRIWQKCRLLLLFYLFLITRFVSLGLGVDVGNVESRQGWFRFPGRPLGCSATTSIAEPKFFNSESRFYPFNVSNHPSSHSSFVFLFFFSLVSSFDSPFALRAARTDFEMSLRAPEQRTNFVVSYLVARLTRIRDRAFFSPRNGFEFICYYVSVELRDDARGGFVRQPRAWQ